VLELLKQEKILLRYCFNSDNFVHRLNQSKTDANHATFKSKCKYSRDDCVNCLCNDDSDMGGAMFNKKSETTKM
jgi:BRCA1-associated protein